MPKPRPQAIHSPHDKFVKETFTQPEAALDLFQTVLPPKLMREAAWSTLTLQPGSFVDEHLAESFSDLLYRVKWRGRPMFLYLLVEHKSTPEEVRLVLLQYMLNIWLQHRKASPSNSFPPIVPIVLYHGKRSWPFSTQFLDLLRIPATLRKELSPLQPSFEHLLLDLSQIPMEAVQGRVRTRLALTLMKAVQEGRVVEWLDRFGTLLMDLAREPETVGQFRTMLRYLFDAEANAASTFRALAGKVKDRKVRTSVMTIAEQLREEGRNEGQRKGTIIGQIQTYQELLNLSLTRAEALARKSDDELQSLLSKLKAQLRARIRN
jgi:predicted transposase/invertase (TIGR01784 family)